MSVVHEKLPIIEGAGGEASVPKTSSKSNAISIQGVDYYLATDLTDEFMNDFHNLPGKELIKKYDLIEAEVVDAEREAQKPQDERNS